MREREHESGEGQREKWTVHLAGSLPGDSGIMTHAEGGCLTGVPEIYIFLINLS